MQKTAAAMAAIGIGLGAFGAHGLEGILENNGSTETWKTAVLYHLVHAVAIYFAAAIDGIRPIAHARWAMRLWLAGILLFSGSLYGLALTGWGVLGPITPLGGLAFIAGWVLLLFPAKKAD